jgi:hypothetical protein
LLVAVDADGGLRWIELGRGYGASANIALNIDGNPVVVGQFAGPLTWRPEQPDETTLIAEGEFDPPATVPLKDIFIAKFRAACPPDGEM